MIENTICGFAVVLSNMSSAPNVQKQQNEIVESPLEFFLHFLNKSNDSNLSIHYTRNSFQLRFNNNRNRPVIFGQVVKQFISSAIQGSIVVQFLQQFFMLFWKKSSHLQGKNLVVPFINKEWNLLFNFWSSLFLLQPTQFSSIIHQLSKSMS